MPDRPLTNKQLAFCREYVIDSNGKQAAIRAGYSEHTAESQASRLLSNVKVKVEIDRLLAITRAESVASRKQRQEFWSATLSNTLKDDTGKAITVSMTDRLRASELLGKSEADFTENINTTTTDQPAELTEADLDQARADAKAVTMSKLAGPKLRKDTA